MENTQSSFFADNSIMSQNKYLRKVFGWMGIGVALTFVTAFLFSTVPSIALALNNTGIIGMIISVVVQFGLIFYMQSRITKLEAKKAKITFAIYSVITGIDFSIFFIALGISDIFAAFMMAAIFFGSLCLIGYTTKMNLSKFRTIFFAGLVSFVLYQLVAMMLGWGADIFWVSFIGLALFVFYTAYDMQNIKNLYVAADADANTLESYSIYGAFNLYLDFLNIFIYILRILISLGLDADD